MLYLPIPLVGLLLLANTVLGLSEFQALEVVKGFADKFLSPSNVQVASTINSTLFVEDVVGTVDVSADFDSRELSTEYLFGLFVENDKDQQDPSPFGIPQSYNVTHIVVQNNYIASSIIFNFYYRSLDRTFPIQVDSYILVNSKRQIQQYDVSFRRWAWATDVIVPLLIPHMAEALNMSASNTTQVLQTYMAQKICHTSTTYCLGEDQQYDSYDACIEFILNRPLGQWYRMGEDNVVCRHLHVRMLPLRPNVHCPHIGPSGGDMCVNRDYFKVVSADHFPRGWIAPKVVTPENKDEVSHIHATSNDTLDPLLEIAMSGSEMHSWDPSLYSIALLGYFLSYYFSAKMLEYIYSRRIKSFSSLPLEHQKNIVMYTMNIIYTSLALGLQLAASPAMGGIYRLWELEALRTGGVIISSLYIFELLYRLHMRIPMIIHHILTIFAISWTVAVFEYTSSMTYMVSAIIWLFQATTEQPTFLGLIGYRLGWSSTLVSRTLKFAAVQTFILKSASAIGLIVYWGVHQNYTYRAIDISWTVLLFLIAIGLLLTQIWGSYVTFSIALRIDKQGISLPTDTCSKSPLTTYHTVRRRSRSSSFKRDWSSTASMSDFTQQRVENGLEVVPPVPDIPQTPYELEVSLPGEHYEMDVKHQHSRNESGLSGSGISAARVPLPASPRSAEYPLDTPLDGRNSDDKIAEEELGSTDFMRSRSILIDDRREEAEDFGRAM